MADLGTVSVRSDGRQLGIRCPDCSSFVPVSFELHPVADAPVVDGHITARLKIENMDEITQQFERHVRADLAAHPSFATPVEDTSVG